MSSRGTDEVANLKAELVIIGGGGAGLAAAATAVENGTSSVIVLEKVGLGGNSALAWGPFGTESPAQRRAAMDVSRDVIFKRVMDFAHWKTNVKIVRDFIDRSGDTIQWLEDKGIFFELMPLYFGQSPLTWHVSEGHGAEIIQVLAAECRKAGVKLLTRTPAKKIITSAKGEISGVMAKTKGGGELTVKGRAVIIASGGYAGSQRLLKKYYPYYQKGMMNMGVRQNTGDGLLMAIELGAASEGLGVLIGGMPGKGPGGKPMEIDSPYQILQVNLGDLVEEPYPICVNEKGERFFDESLRVHHRVVSNPATKAAYTLFDQKMVDHMTEHGIAMGHGRDRMYKRIKLQGLAGELKKQADAGFMRIADSWNGIAEYIGVETEVLKATIQEYNADCDRGHDSFLVKDPRYLWPLRNPPYYAIGGNHKGLLDTIGGIKINECMEVLDGQDNPIPGLYAAGVVAGGWQACSYNGYQSSGAALGFALNSGRIAVENALKFVSG